MKVIFELFKELYQNIPLYALLDAGSPVKFANIFLYGSLKGLKVEETFKRDMDLFYKHVNYLMENSIDDIPYFRMLDYYFRKIREYKRVCGFNKTIIHQ